MAFVPEAANWEPGIYQYEETDVLQGGPNGIDNLQAKQIANRLLWLHANRQPLDATLTALAAVVTAANKLIYATGSDTFATTDLSAFIRTLLDDADAATARTTLGAQASDATLTALAAVVTAANKLIYATGADTFATTDLSAFARTLLDDADAAAARATLGVGTAATLASSTDGTLSGNSDANIPTQKAVKTYVDGLMAANDAMIFKGVIDCSASPNYPAADRGHTYRVSVAGKIGGAAGPNVEAGDILLCITDGTVAGTHAAAGANWGIIQLNIDGALTTANIGSTVQAYDADLAAIAALASAADKMPYATGVGTWALATLSAFARTLLDDADASAARTTLGAQASDATLTALAAVVTAANKLIYATGADTFATTDLSAFARTLLDDADAAAARATIGVNDASYITTGDLAAARIAAALNAGGSAPMYTCRAWGNFDGTGATAIKASGNLSSLTDNGTGDYTPNFLTALPDGDFSAIASAIGQTTIAENLIAVANSGAAQKTASACRIKITNTTGTARDADNVSFAIFR